MNRRESYFLCQHLNISERSYCALTSRHFLEITDLFEENKGLSQLRNRCWTTLVLPSWKTALTHEYLPTLN